MEEPRRWHTNVTEMMTIFHDGLVALIPIAERARIPWREDTYDDWDDMATALFKCLVTDAIMNADTLLVQPIVAPTIAEYDIMHNDYHELSFIEVTLADGAIPPYLVFHSLATAERPFDTVRCRLVDSGGTVLGESFEAIPVDRVEFQFRLRLPSGELRSMRDIVVEL